MIDPRLAHAVAVAREGSFTKAATVIGVTQPAITKSIRDLEQRLGYQLFYRTSRGVVLTVQGREFVERAVRILEDARELMTSPASKDPYAGVLRIGVCPASLEWLLVIPLADMIRRHPAIRVEVTGGKFETMVQLLRTGAVDVAVGFEAAFREWPDLTRHPIAALRPALFVRARHPLLELGRITIDDLSRYEFISPSDSRPYGELIRELYEGRNIDWRKNLHVIDYFPAVRQLVAMTDAIGTVAMSNAMEAALDKRFAILNGVDLLPESNMSCATRARWSPRPATKAFINTMAKLLPGKA
jgi:DNA-binding transcriptional LysR family regulator